MQVTTRRGDVEGIPMRWLESGSAGRDDAAEAGRPTVILVHGIPTSPELWRHVIPRLADADLRVRAWEMVGYGDSIPAGRGRDISLSRQAEYLLAWLESLSVDRAVLVGHDLGGGVAQIAAARAPERCAGLVLTNAVAYDAWPVLPIRVLRRGGSLFGRMPEPVWRRTFEWAIRSMHEDRTAGLESARIHWTHYARHGGGRAMVHQARFLDAADTLAVADDVRSLDLPARVVWGDADPFLPMGHAARLATDLGTSVRAIPGGLHFTPEDHPAAVADAVLEVAA